ncbi:MAG: ORF6N domain-containing protein [Acidobacteria bacterium]|nr:ORF6N domain-containing protein [Acidobacteriota bacterium]
MAPIRGLVPLHRIAPAILFFRGHRVMLDTDLALLYGVETKALNQAVRRNRERFPADFMFQLSDDEAASLRSQTVTLKARRGQHRKYRPYAFTEQGVAMLSGVLKSPRAVRVNVAIMRTFVRLRALVDSRSELVKRVDALEEKYDDQFAEVFRAIRRLMAPPLPAKRRIGFGVKGP